MSRPLPTYVFSALVVLLCAASPVSALEDAAAMAKLDSVLEKQDLILRQLDEIKEELNVVKIRASQR
ncbi:MAG: hypothetical protein MOGMAGMI_02206 [Candidatus Omnitrophica bacterium]|nr:hypothetical protein [Candidatus Omnitrophota bacterium]